jgi:hypothetical protein
MNKLKRYSKVIIFDTLAILCFIGVALFGWLPGPGGIPLLLLGLSFLAVNHDWAERWIETVKIHGITIKQRLFPKNPLIRTMYDICAVLFISVGLYLAFLATNRLYAAAGAVLISGSVVLLLFNRERIDKLADVFKQKKR